MNTAQRAKIRLDWKTGVAATVRFQCVRHQGALVLQWSNWGSCDTSVHSPDQLASIAVPAQDWDAIAKKDNLNEMSMELRRLEAMVKEIHEEMLFLRTREEEMRDLNGEISYPEARC